MTKIMINFRMDADLKKEMKTVCSDMEMSLMKRGRIIFIGRSKMERY